MPYSERVEKKESWKEGLVFEDDPANVIVIHDWYLQHRCGKYVGTLSKGWQDRTGRVGPGTLKMAAKDMDKIHWNCSNCKKVIPPEVVMAARLAK